MKTKIKLAIAALSVLIAQKTLIAQSTSGSNTLTGTLPASPTQYLGSFNAADVIFKSTNVERMRISAAGNFGIGIAAPVDKFHLHQGLLKLSGNNSWGGPMVVFGDLATAGTGNWGIEYVTSGNKGLNFWRPFTAGNPNPGNNFLFLADATGNVGIRTNNPTANFTVNGNVLIGDPATITLPAGYKLYVETGILTEKVKVGVKNTSNWSDYVFDEKYTLKSIAELEAFVKENKHLPNVPSANEVVKNGIDLGSMDATLLEKIEELSLYIIQQNKRIEALEKEITKK